MTRTFLVLALVAACQPAQPVFDLQFSSGPAQECPSTDCNEIAMNCHMFMGVRILDPADPMAPFHSECIEIPMTARSNICPIGGLELQPHELPYRDLEVQIAIYPAEVVGDPDPVSGLYNCPSDTTYDAVDGFPISGEVALGGRGYYRPGDDTIHVTLGCSNLTILANDMCQGVSNTTVQATVDDFETHLSVLSSQADRIAVAVGEPRTAGTGYELRPSDVTTLDRAPIAAPAWSRDVPRMFQGSACLTVDEDTAGSTTTVACTKVSMIAEQLSLVGVRLSKSSLDQILAALSLAQFPAEGMTIGVVVDGGTPVGSQIVTTTDGTIEYLNATRTGLGGISTAGGSLGGVFVSRDATYGTTFTTTRLGATAAAFGGRIDDKVTIVVLDLARPTQPD